MVARFQKNTAGPLSDFDGFDKKTMYQMVPVGSRREMGVVTESQELLLAVQDTDVASLASFSSTGRLTPPFLTVTEIVVPANARTLFSIMGRSVGATELALRDRDGRVVASLLVSVKGKITRRYAICMLSDIRHTTARTTADASEVARRVEQVYLNQANVSLTALEPPTPIIVPKNLGNPINTDRSDVQAAILDAVPSRFMAADIIFVCTWDLIGHVANQIGTGLVGLKFAYVEDLASLPLSAVLFSHECGHVLGLAEHNGDPEAIMFKVVKGKRFMQFEIDRLNDTGTVA